MRWTFVILICAAALTGARIAYTLYKARGSQQDDWDARLVQNLRAAGALEADLEVI